MIAGIPGTGIGGVFYLLIALWMPIREFYFKLLRWNSERWHIVRRHLPLTCSIIFGMWTTGWLLGWVLSVILPIGVRTNLGGIGHGSTNILQIAPLILTLATHVSVYLAVQVLRLVVRRDS